MTTPPGDENNPQPEDSSLSKLRDFDKVRERLTVRFEVRHVVQGVAGVLVLLALAFAGGWWTGLSGWRPGWLLSGPKTQVAASGAEVLPAPLGAPGTDAAVGAGAAVAIAPVATSEAIAEAADPDERLVADNEGAPTPTSPDDVADADLALIAPPPPPEAASETRVAAEPVAVIAESSETASPPSEEDGTAPGGKAKGSAGETAPKAQAERPTPKAGRPAAGKYVIQIKAFHNEAEAIAFAESLRAKGYTVAVSSVEVPDKGQFFRVRMGPFGSLDSARTAQKRLEAAEGHVTIILATP